MSVHVDSPEPLGISDGIRDGIPVFVGYLSASIAYGLSASTIGFTTLQAVLMSALVFTGSGQLLALKLLGAGATPFAIAVSVLMLNLRYLFMTASLDTKLPSSMGKAKKSLLSFCIADEAFSIASLKKEPLTQKYMFTLVLVCYVGWVLGTYIGALTGSILTPELQMAATVTLYAMFASLLSTETKRSNMVWIVAGVSALLNSLLTFFTPLAAGWAFIISMVSATVVGAFIMPDEDATKEVTACR